MNSMMEKTSDGEHTFDQWAVVEIFGHQRIAGRVSEQSIGGCSFVRVDVPAVGKEQAFTKLFGHGAIYSITFTDEAASRLAAVAIQSRPINTWELHSALQSLEHVKMPDTTGDDSIPF